MFRARLISQSTVNCLFFALILGLFLTTGPDILTRKIHDPVFVVGSLWLVLLGIEQVRRKIVAHTKNTSTSESTSAEKLCPFCAEQIKFKATVCRFCCSDLNAAAPNGVLAASIALTLFIVCFRGPHDLLAVRNSLDTLNQNLTGYSYGHFEYQETGAIGSLRESIDGLKEELVSNRESKAKLERP